MSAENKQDIEKIRLSVSTRAEEIVLEIMPKKVLELTELLEQPEISIKLSQIQSPVDVSALKNIFKSCSETCQDESNLALKRRKLTQEDNCLEDARVSCLKDCTSVDLNIDVANLLNKLKAYVLEFIELLMAIKIWVQLNIPRIEDGNNFGVSIQEDTLSELSRAEEAAFSSVDRIPKYFLNRAQYIAKSLKYPGIQDYKQSIIELDQKEMINAVFALMDLKNSYSIFHDMIIKNWAKIIKPRSNNDTAIY